MEKIKIIMMGKLDVKEICLMALKNYSKDKTKLTFKGDDIIITVEDKYYTDKIYGRVIKNNYYFARVQHIPHEVYIDYYNEFFSVGEELKLC